MRIIENEFYDRIRENPVIAAVNNLKKLEKAIKSPCEIIFLLTGDIFNLQELVNHVKASGKSVFVHLDLIEGFSRNVCALKYINEIIVPNGIITTKSSLIRTAKEMGLFSIQRLFMLDALSLQSGINSIKTIRPDAVEILPGIMPRVTKTISTEVNIPIITGGLISDKEDVIASIKAGAVGISTSKEEIWYM
ncbi:glycerol-3-phosphate responsive antiterminator [Clostridium bowmanii]|uniref:glycerol-3-phosphate responsive antiterminator n=1 Tax=Clostridium bowmanii TaxID=132925 RepID=UPI001CD2BA6B|nr:glycerol-3-phosphate responsive antiterminator [Clostridium bowmanii]MCA1074336.1 glycerol-3-phosphate responsive antiterminator [Clostridium bowmanii]